MNPTYPAVLAALTPLLLSSSLAAETVRCLTEPFGDVKMSVVVPGNVSAIHYGEGDFVQGGEVILELDTKMEQLDVDRRTVLVDTLKASLERSEMLLKNTSSISMEEVDQARGEFQMATIELELARESMKMKQLRAPFSGVITGLPIEVGEYCEPAQPILRLVDTRQFYCVANIDPAIAVRLKEEDPVTYKSGGAFGSNEIPGKVVFISPVLDPASGLLRIKAIFPNPEGNVRPGESGFLELNSEQ